MEVRPNGAQRVVGVVALGAVLWFVGSFLTSATALTGWTGSAPLQAAFPAHDRLSSIGNLLVWIALVVGWFIVSMFLLRSTVHASRRGAVGQGARQDLLAPTGTWTAVDWTYKALGAAASRLSGGTVGGGWWRGGSRSSRLVVAAAIAATASSTAGPFATDGRTTPLTLRTY